MHHDILPSREEAHAGSKECATRDVGQLGMCSNSHSHKGIPEATYPHKVSQQHFLIEVFLFPSLPLEILKSGGILDENSGFQTSMRKKTFFHYFFLNGICVFFGICVFLCLHFLAYNQCERKVSLLARGESKRLHPSNPLNFKALLMFLSSDIVRHTVLDILAIAPNLCPVHFSCFQSSPVTKIFSFSFVHEKKAAASSLTKLASYNHALSIQKFLVVSRTEQQC